jgi:hypothetical protein
MEAIRTIETSVNYTALYRSRQNTSDEF